MTILDVYVPRPLEQWTIGECDYRVCHKRNILVTVTWYELHWTYEVTSGVTHITKKFRSLGELYEWAEEQGIAPGRTQLALEV